MRSRNTLHTYGGYVRNRGDWVRKYCTDEQRRVEFHGKRRNTCTSSSVGSSRNLQVASLILLWVVYCTALDSSGPRGMVGVRAVDRGWLVAHKRFTASMSMFDITSSPMAVMSPALFSKDPMV